MSFIQQLYCIIPFRYYSLFPSFRAQSFRNWYSSFSQECVLRPAVPNSQKEQSSLFQQLTWRRESNKYSKHCASVKRKRVIERWIRYDCYVMSSVYGLWNTCIFIREHTWEKKIPLKSFLHAVYFGRKEICCIFQICCVLCLLFYAKYLSFYNLDLFFSNFTFL